MATRKEAGERRVIEQGYRIVQVEPFSLCERAAILSRHTLMSGDGTPCGGDET